VGTIGAWVLDQALTDWTRWREDFPALTLNVNLSVRQLRQPDLVDTVAKALLRHRTDPAAVCLELTESVLMDDAGGPTTPCGTLQRLHDLGVRLAIDDFGTGYSSLAYLRRFPIDLLKIDRQFTAGLGRVPQDRAIVATIIHLGHALGLTVTAEGVETADQLAELQRLGCDQAQGFHLAHPQPAELLEDLLRSRRRRSNVTA